MPHYDLPAQRSAIVETLLPGEQRGRIGVWQEPVRREKVCRVDHQIPLIEEPLEPRDPPIVAFGVTGALALLVLTAVVLRKRKDSTS